MKKTPCESCKHQVICILEQDMVRLKKLTDNWAKDFDALPTMTFSVEATCKRHENKEDIHYGY